MQVEVSYSQIPTALLCCYQVGMELSLRIRDYRLQKGLTLSELADKVGVSTPHLSEVERGKKNLNNHLLVRIASALGVQPEDLVSSENRSAVAALYDELQSLSTEDQRRVEAFVAALRQSRADA